MSVAGDTARFNPVADAVAQLRQVDDLPDNIEAVQEAAEAVLRRSNLPEDVVEFLISRHRRNQFVHTQAYQI